jgi:hypothetical protein
MATALPPGKFFTGIISSAASPLLTQGKFDCVRRVVRDEDGRSIHAFSPGPLRTKEKEIAC